MPDVDELLYRELFDAPLPADEFLSAWDDDIGDPASEVRIQEFVAKRPKLGNVTVYVFQGGLVATEDKRGLWQAYESRARVEERQYFHDWGAFIRGGWTLKVPTEDGVYPCRSLEGWRGPDRTLKRVNGRLIDTTPGGGMVPPGKVSNWVAYWWTHKFPNLKGAL